MKRYDAEYCERDVITNACDETNVNEYIKQSIVRYFNDYPVDEIENVNFTIRVDHDCEFIYVHAIDVDDQMFVILCLSLCDE